MSDASVQEVMNRYPGGFIDRDTFPLYEGFLNERLLFSRCGDCGQFFQPMGSSCPNCWSDDITPTEVDGSGTIFTFVILHVGPLRGVEGVDYEAGYPLGVVELDAQPGLRMTGPVVGCAPEDVQVGMKVRLTWIDRQGAPVPAFEPATA